MFGNIFDDHKEIDRLAVQNRLLKEYELPVYQRLMEGRTGLRVLDVGCNNGSKTADRFAHPSVEKIIGLEYNQDLVEEAQATYGDRWFSFYQCDVEQPDFAPKLRGWMGESQIEAFDLIHISLVLLHLERPGLLLGILRGFLAPGGKLMIIEANDSVSALSNDPGGLFTEFMDILIHDPFSGERNFGTKVPRLLEVQGYCEIVLENEMLEELDDVPDEVYDLLDPDKVGRVMADREGGVFIDGYYVVTSGYEPVLVYNDVLPEPQEDWVFRLEVAPNLSSETKNLTFPADKNYLKNIDKCNIMKFESALPQISNSAVESAEDIYLLNEIAKKYSELSREDAAKFKAVLQSEKWDGLYEAEDILKNLGRYDFDISVTDASDFGRKYLSEMLTPDFDRSLLDGVNTAKLAGNVFRVNGGAITLYGAVSNYGGQLYSMIEAPQQEQESSFEMGGIS